MKQHGRGISAFEAMIVVALIGGFLGTAAAYQRRLLVRAKELALAAELRNLRASLSFFESVYHRRPASLEELVSDAMRRVRVGGGHWERDDDPARAGTIVDIFHHPYAYDPVAGTIRSRTQGYESW